MKDNTINSGLLICPILEAGKSGVGDYCRKLAEELVLNDLALRLCAWNDPFVLAPSVEGQGPISMVRLPAKSVWKVKEQAFKQLFLPDSTSWLSLQFVTYGYHPKGLPFGMGRRLRALIGSAPVEIMFHELWCGGHGARLRDRVYGILQRWIIRDLVRHLNPDAIHTHSTPYLEALHREGWKASRLPLFSNIPVEEPWSREQFGRWLESRSGDRDMTGRTVFCLFGSLYPQWRPDSLLPILRKQLTQSGRKGLILSVGHRGIAGNEIWKSLEAESDDLLLCLDIGPLPEAEISQCLHASDYGISTTPPDLIEKSAAAAPMFEHGLPVLASRPPINGWEMAKRVSADEPLLVYGDALQRFFSMQKRTPDRQRLAQVASQFLSDIGKASQRG